MDIIYEDNHLIAINKTNHDLVQGDSTGDESLDQQVKAYIKEKYNKPGEVYLGVTHRLDRPVSGVVIFAKTGKALSRMNSLFREGGIKKHYWAIVKNLPDKPEGTLVHHLIRDQAKNKAFVRQNAGNNSKEARLEYRLLASSDKYHLLQIDLLTGRHHQIRAQLAHIGSPIKGDLKYGFPRSNPDGGISLHARQVHFVHPIKDEPVTLTAQPPASDPLWEVFLNRVK